MKSIFGSSRCTDDLAVNAKGTSEQASHVFSGFRFNYMHSHSGHRNITIEFNFKHTIKMNTIY